MERVWLLKTWERRKSLWIWSRRPQTWMFYGTWALLVMLGQDAQREGTQMIQTPLNGTHVPAINKKRKGNKVFHQ